MDAELGYVPPPPHALPHVEYGTELNETARANGLWAARFSAVILSCSGVRGRWGSVSCAAFQAMSSACARPVETSRPMRAAIVRATERRAMRIADSFGDDRGRHPVYAPAHSDRKGFRRFAAHFFHSRDGRITRKMEPTREQAWETLTRYTKSESLLRHALAVVASTAAYARKLGGDEEQWWVAALLHDFDYEMHPTLDKHPQDGAPI